MNTPKCLLAALIMFTMFSAGSHGQGQWCDEGDCLATCPHTLFMVDYDWWWCSCPTFSYCGADQYQTCNTCIINYLYWCDDPWNPYCHTYILYGYNQFCGCQSGYAGAGCPPSISPGKARPTGRSTGRPTGRVKDGQGMQKPKGGKLS